MMSNYLENKLSYITVSLTFILLYFVRWKVGDTFLLGDRLFEYGGLVQIIAISIFSGYVVKKLYDRKTRAIFRRRLWLIFSVVFFLQLLLGITVDALFLISGKLHYPIPSVILTGAIYRWELAFMPILFLFTVILSGGAWCSYLCYFGVMDSLSAGSGPRKAPLFRLSKEVIRVLFLVIFVLTAFILRLVDNSSLYAAVGGAISGLAGICIILIVSRRYKTMVHCTYFCPIGTIVSYLKFLSPFRYRFGGKCTKCKACMTSCRYGALSKEDIERGKIGRSCTYCGDCMSKCRHGGFEYHFFKCSAETSEKIFIVTISILYAVFICVARV